MTNDEQHVRTCNLNAHAVWSLAMWGSADLALDRGQTILAPVGYYYSAFHIAFALVNAKAEVPLADLSHARHGAIESWTERYVGVWPLMQFKFLRDVRESINYLGLGDGPGKLHVVRGGPLVFHVPTDDGQVRERRWTLPEALAQARDFSRSFVKKALEQIEQSCSTLGWPGPRRNDPDDGWIGEYLQEDLLRSIVPQGGERQEILRRGISLLG